MKTRISLFVLILSTVIITGSQKLSSENERLVLDDFSGQKNIFFNTWRMYDENKGSLAKAYRVYSIRSENGRNYLHASTRHDGQDHCQIGKQVSSVNFSRVDKEWNIKKFPYLTWKWRAIELPAGADESIDEKNDSVAGIYVVFQKAYVPLLSWRYQPVNVIKYVWSTTLPKDRVVSRNMQKFGILYFQGRYIVLQSGPKNMNRWIEEKRNVLEDYRRVFGSDPKYDPIILGILTDSNSTRSHAVADYTDIIAERN